MLCVGKDHFHLGHPATYEKLTKPNPKWHIEIQLDTFYIGTKMPSCLKYYPLPGSVPKFVFQVTLDVFQSI